MTTVDPVPDSRPPETNAPPPILQQHVVRSTRMSRVWSQVILFTLVLLVLLIFILQNGQRAKVSFLGFHGHLPLAVAMLLAAVAGALLAAIPGIGRMIQLRRVARRHRYADAQAPPRVPAEPAGPAGPVPPAVPAGPAPTTVQPGPAQATGPRLTLRRFRGNMNHDVPRT